MADVGFDELDAPIKRLQGAFAPTPYAPSLEQAIVPNPQTVRDAIVALLEE